MDKFRMVMEVAEGLRGEFGAEIDAHPGSATVEAGQVNRAFRVAVGCILKAIVPREGNSPGLRTSVLRRAAKSRLASAGISDATAETLLDLEPHLDEAWLAYLALAPESVIRDL